MSEIKLEKRLTCMYCGAPAGWEQNEQVAIEAEAELAKERENTCATRVQWTLEKAWRTAAEQALTELQAGLAKEREDNEQMKLAADAVVSGLNNQLAKEREAHEETKRMLAEEVQDNISLRDKHVTQTAADEIKWLEQRLAELEPVIEAVRDAKQSRFAQSDDELISKLYCIRDAARKAGVV
jgi:hypothetical protein